MSIKKITKWALVIALYVALTYLFAFMSFETIQFRIAEILVLLAFYRKDYIIPLVVATAIANLASPLGPIDIAFGTMGTLLSVIAIHLVSRVKDKFPASWVALFTASLFPVLFNAVFVGWELGIVYDLPFLPTALSVAIGEAAVVSVVGVAAFALLERNRAVLSLITTDGFQMDEVEDHKE